VVTKPKGRRRTGRPKHELIDGVLEDIKKLEELVDSCQGQGSQGPCWAVELLLMMMTTI
jgi:hypothetical protein